MVHSNGKTKAFRTVQHSSKRVCALVELRGFC